MRILEYINNTSTNNDVLSVSLYNSSSSSLERGVNWIYSTLDTTLYYDFNIFYFLTPLALFQEMLNIHNIGYEVATWEESMSSLFWSILSDSSILNGFYQNPYLNSWTRYFSQSVESSIMLYVHPELFFINNAIVNTFVLPYVSNFFYSVLLNSIIEGYTSPVFVALNVLINTAFFSLLILFYFSYYTSNTKDENTIDQDFFLASMTVEAEEEIASIDDISIALVFLVFLFGWYFYANCLFILTYVPELSVVFYSLPFLYYIIFFVPTLLVYDFGIFFLTYLRGAATTASLAMELLYDYIAFAAFYVRLGVQNVRLLLMLFTYFSLYECILTFVTFESLFNSSEYISETVNSNHNYMGYNSYYFLLKIPTQLLYWLYELLHTFFVVTAQFIAFFAMVFWLFLFLYTMFVAEQQERYFFEKKEFRKNLYKKIYKK